MDLPSISPDVYKDKSLYPTPALEQNLAWRNQIATGRVAETIITSIGASCLSAGLDLQGLATDGLSAKAQMWQANLRLVDYLIDPNFPKFGRDGKWMLKIVQDLRVYVEEGLEIHPTLELEDIRQWGRIGLGQAIERWDPSRGGLGGVVRMAVRSNVQRCFMNEGRIIRITHPDSKKPRDTRSRFHDAYIHRLEGGFSDDYMELETDPAYLLTQVEPLVAVPDINGAGLDTYQRRFIPDDAIGNTPGHDVMAPSWSDDSGLAYNFSRDDIDRLLNMLSPRQKYIVEQLFGLSGKEPRTVRSVADELDLTNQGVRAAKLSALTTMRKQLNVADTIKPTKTAKAVKPPQIDPRIAESASTLLPPPAVLPDLPTFSRSEQKLGMSHHEWLNLALLHMYRVWYESRNRGENIRLGQIREQLKNSTILPFLSSECDLISSIGGRTGETKVALGCLTQAGAQKVMDRYRLSTISTATLRRYNQSSTASV